MFFNIITLFYVGIAWPLEGQPFYLKKLSEFLPIRIVGSMMTNIALKGWTFENSSIITGFLITLSYNILLILIIIIMAVLKNNMWLSK